MISFKMNPTNDSIATAAVSATIPTHLTEVPSELRALAKRCAKSPPARKALRSLARLIEAFLYSQLRERICQLRGMVFEPSTVPLAVRDAQAIERARAFLDGACDEAELLKAVVDSAAYYAASQRRSTPHRLPSRDALADIVRALGPALQKHADEQELWPLLADLEAAFIKADAKVQADEEAQERARLEKVIRLFDNGQAKSPTPSSVKEPTT